MRQDKELSEAVARNYKHPCKSCGLEDSVRDFGLMCESCQRESKFTVSGKELTAHLQEQQRMSDADFARRERENEEFSKRQTETQAAYLVELDRRQERVNKLSAERLKKDELHRLYTLFLRQRLQGSAVAGRLEHEDALDQARRAQAYFDGEVEQ